MQDALACLEGSPIDQASIPALVNLSVPMEFADVEAVVEDVGETGACEPRLALSVSVPFGGKLVG